MTTKPATLAPAVRLATENSVRIPNESPEYRAARSALLAEEIELRRQMERVASQRRALPPGGLASGDYRFEGEEGLIDFTGLFAGKQTLAVYSFMFGPQRERPCPMCTNLLGPWDANAADIGQKLSLVVVALSPIGRLTAWKAARGWKNLRLYSDVNGAYSRDYLGVLPDGSEIPSFSLFSRRDGSVRHFWSDEMTDSVADQGQDPRGTPVSYAPLWSMLDSTPEGREPNWYPSLNYD